MNQIMNKPRRYVWAQEIMIVYEAQSHGPGPSVPMFNYHVWGPLNYPPKKLHISRNIFKNLGQFKLD